VIQRRFRHEIDEGRSDGDIRIRGKLFHHAMEGSQRALEVCAVNLCGWSLNAPQTVVNVVQHGAPVSPVFGLVIPREIYKFEKAQ
jgi:hypothetical protein